VSVFRAIVFSSVVVGIVVGAVITMAQEFGTVPLILKGEAYEAAAAQAASAQSATGASVAEERAAEQAATKHETREHSNGPEYREAVWEPREGWERKGFTAIANVLTSIGFALVLGGIYALRNDVVTWYEGLLWGLAGFLVFTVAPGLGLPPELPGVPSAPLEPRQLWWVATAVATAVGLGLIFLKRTLWASVLGLILIALPHLVGAPHLEEVRSNVPEVLSHQFIVAVTLTSLLSWALLGSLTAVAYARLSADSPAPISNPA
jgi:cobalt transporter subunit CbtA